MTVAVERSMEIDNTRNKGRRMRRFLARMGTAAPAGSMPYLAMNDTTH
jgi:hypothetical protein